MRSSGWSPARPSAVPSNSRWRLSRTSTASDPDPARSVGWCLRPGGWSYLQLTTVLTPSERVARAAFELTTAVSYRVAMLWLVFAVVYTGRREWLTTRRVAALWSPLTAYLCLRWTEQYHGLTRTPVTVETVSGITAPTAAMTQSGFGAVLLSYGFVVAGFALLIWLLSGSENVYRRETATIVVGASFSAVGTAAFTAGYSLHPGVSLVPRLFVVHGVVTALALFRYDFLSVGPVATDMLAEELDEPVLVLDDRGTVVDHKPGRDAALGGVAARPTRRRSGSGRVWAATDGQTRHGRGTQLRPRGLRRD